VDVYVDAVFFEGAREGADERRTWAACARHAPRRPPVVDLDRDALPPAPNRNGMAVHGQGQVGLDEERAPTGSGAAH
jgi:hypothetical protein